MWTTPPSDLAVGVLDVERELPVLVVGLTDLLRLKEAADRPQDREDVRALRALGAV